MNPDQQPPLEHPEKPLNHQPGQPVSESLPVATSQPSESLPPIKPQDSATINTQGYAHPIVDKPKKAYHPKRFLIALGVFVAICVLAVAAMLLFALLPMPAPKTTTTPTKRTTTVKADTIDAKLAIEHTKEYFKGTQTAKNSLTLPVRATGKDFYTIIPDIKPLASVAGLVAAGKADAQLASIVHSLEGDDFTKRITADGANNTNYLADFTRPETFCEVAVTKQKDANADQWIEVRCLDMTTYSEYAAAQEPLVSLYTPLSATSVLYGFVGKPAPKAGKTAGFMTAELQVSIIVDNHTTSTGNYALYYQTPDGLWHYFRDRDASQAFDCDEYNTNDLRNAYTGVSCRNTSKNTIEVVEPPKKKS